MFFYQNKIKVKDVIFSFSPSSGRATLTGRRHTKRWLKWSYHAPPSKSSLDAAEYKRYKKGLLLNIFAHVMNCTWLFHVIMITVEVDQNFYFLCLLLSLTLCLTLIKTGTISRVNCKKLFDPY